MAKSKGYNAMYLDYFNAFEMRLDHLILTLKEEKLYEKHANKILSLQNLSGAGKDALARCSNMNDFDKIQANLFSCCLSLYKLRKEIGSDISEHCLPLASLKNTLKTYAKELNSLREEMINKEDNKKMIAGVTKSKSI